MSGVTRPEPVFSVAYFLTLAKALDSDRRRYGPASKRKLYADGPIFWTVINKTEALLTLGGLDARNRV